MAAAAGSGESGGAELPGACPGADSGNVSQSHSRASGLGEPEDDDNLEALLSATATAYSAYLLVDRSLFSDEIESLDKNLEDLLTRVDEFVGMLDIIRSDSSQVINESIPEIYTKATEMRHIYRKIDKLEAFVKMISNSVAGLEERVTKAETDLGAFPSTFKKILHTISIPSFLNTVYRRPEVTRNLFFNAAFKNHLPHGNNRPSMSLQSSSRLKTIFRVLMKHLTNDFCFGIDVTQPEWRQPSERKKC